MKTRKEFKFTKQYQRRQNMINPPGDKKMKSNNSISRREEIL
jgi:hypothetical protein